MAPGSALSGETLQKSGAGCESPPLGDWPGRPDARRAFGLVPEAAPGPACSGWIGPVDPPESAFMARRAALAASGWTRAPSSLIRSIFVQSSWKVLNLFTMLLYRK